MVSSAWSDDFLDAFIKTDHYGFFTACIMSGKSVKNCHSIYYFLIIQHLACMSKYNGSKTGPKMDLLNQQNAARENW